VNGGYEGLGHRLRALLLSFLNVLPFLQMNSLPTWEGNSMKTYKVRWYGRDRDAKFYEWSGPRPVAEVDGLRVKGPAFYHRVDSFQSLHLASYEAVQEVLPSNELQPVRWFDGRAALQIAAFRHNVVTCSYADGTTGVLAPYGEVLIAALVTRGPARRGLPLLAPGLHHVGGFILHLPVTTLEARDLGLQIFGMPKFVADMGFREEPLLRQLRLSEQDSEILTLTIRPTGPVTTDRSPVLLYSSLHAELLQTTVRLHGHRQVRLGRQAGALQLGNHPVADQLRALGVSRAPLMVANYLDARFILPYGNPIGAAQDYTGYPGRDRMRGRFTVEYPGTGPIDQYSVPPGVLSPATTFPVAAG
jgi:Acetoacetate decarboxylase (ADC)